MGKERLQNKMDHANLMYTEMLNTISDGTFLYMEEKRDTAEQLAEALSRKAELTKKRETDLTLLTNIKISLQQMEQVCKVIKDPKEKKILAKIRIPSAKGRFSLDAQMMEVMDIKNSCT